MIYSLTGPCCGWVTLAWKLLAQSTRLLNRQGFLGILLIDKASVWYGKERMKEESRLKPVGQGLMYRVKDGEAR